MSVGSLTVDVGQVSPKKARFPSVTETQMGRNLEASIQPSAEYNHCQHFSRLPLFTQNLQGLENFPRTEIPHHPSGLFQG